MKKIVHKKNETLINISLSPKQLTAIKNEIELFYYECVNWNDYPNDIYELCENKTFIKKYPNYHNLLIEFGFDLPF